MVDQAGPTPPSASTVHSPAITLPKGGGAIRGMGEKFAANPVTGTASVSVPIATSPARSDFGPQLSLTYDSGAGNGPFGFGWSLSLPSITRKTDQGLPQYVDSDVFVFAGAEDLVPVRPDGGWGPRTVDGRTYEIRRYRPRIEGLFTRIERWTNVDDATDVCWRSLSRENITTWYGRTAESRIADPEDPRRIFSWLVCQSHDDKGNAVVYGYRAEDSARIFEDAAGTVRPQPHERNRSDRSRTAQRYLTSIRYGNRSPYFPVLRENAAWPEPPKARLTEDGGDAWMFEVVLDYGDHDAAVPTPHDATGWPARRDPFSTYRAGFEVRTYRLCRRALMFHHFPDEAGVGRDCLVRSTDFAHADGPGYSFLTAVTQTGHRRDGAGYARRSLPPVEFEYTEAVVHDVLESVDPASLENLPIGLDGRVYRWTDLHGEGAPGILTEQGGGWFYRRNWSPLGDAARFAPRETVALMPRVENSEGAEFHDLAGDGQPDLVLWHAPAPGFYEHDEAEGWQPFRPFTKQLHHDIRDPNLRLVDLDGDGWADVLITEDDAVVWHPSLAEEGFGPARRVASPPDEEKGPRLVFDDSTQSVFLADMSGDGLTDLVRIRNSEVCYWPNLGYGRFGAKITMTFVDGAGRSASFDQRDQFDQKRLRLADIDGSGTTDIIYLHRDGVRLYFNRSGNGWSQPHRLDVVPPVDDLVSVVPVDLLGDGTACLVWSSARPGDTGRSMRYVSLMGGRKPHLLARTVNNLGAETRVAYAPSTRFYLQDKRAGRPWVTRLPFPVHVVERVETYDHVSRNRFVTRYAYHHGHFDGEEREFRGFGLVEQWDTEELAALADGAAPATNVDAASHVPPVHTRTWFHTGVHSGLGWVARQYEHEYDLEPGLTVETARPLLLDDTPLPAGLTVAEEREACRALKGSMLRQEVYALDGVGRSPDRPSGLPYVVTEQSFTVRPLQPRGDNRHAVFVRHVVEAISYHYEREGGDPRIAHALTLEVDEYGNVLKHAAIGYGRRTSPLAQAWDRDRQTTALLTYTEDRVTNAVDGPDAHRTPLPCESVTFELTGYTATGPAGRYQAADLVEPDPVAPGRLWHRFTAPDVPYEGSASGSQRRRLTERLRTLYRRDDLTGLLPLGLVEPLALPGDSYHLAFTPGLLDQTFVRPCPGRPDEHLLPPAARATVLGIQGGYVDLDGDGHWWVPSGRSFYHPDDVTATAELAEARAHFFLPRRYRDPFGAVSTVAYDGPADPLKLRYDLLMTQTRDALDNRVTVDAVDYRVLRARLVSDPNRNQTEVSFDTLGLVVGTALMGKPAPAAAEGDSLVGFEPDLTQAQLDAFVDAADPHPVATTLLADATTRIVYDLDRFRRTRQAFPEHPERWQPACAATLTRETHVHAPAPAAASRLQLSVSYSDGFGREIQQKVQAEPGPVPQRAGVGPRWVGTGWTVFNNNGQPVRQYEPFFTDTHGFEFDVRVGVSPVVFYDPLGRVVATLHPDHSYDKVVFDPWQQTTWDVNDTCAPRNLQTGDPRTDPDIGGYAAAYFRALPVDPARPWRTWYSHRIGGELGPREQEAAERAAAHADTPSTVHLDALGRAFLTVVRNRVVCPGHPLDGRPDEEVHSRVDLDIEGNQRTVFDERALPDGVDLPVGPVEQRVVLRCVHDLRGHRIQQASMEAGPRWRLGDVAGNPIRTWDGRGHTVATTYDTLRRPVGQTVRGTWSGPDPLGPNSDPRTLTDDLLVNRTEYGEGIANAEALNLRTRLYRHWDSAGLTTQARIGAAGAPVEAYDFKGNPLATTRQLVSDYTGIPDWQGAPALEAETFETSTRYDALNRPIQTVAPHSSLVRPGRPTTVHVIQPTFNEANLLERMDVWLDRAAVPAGLLDPTTEAPAPVGVADIDYDAKGLRTLVDYRTADATVVRTTYTYDRDTSRLTHLYTRRGVDPATAQGMAFTADCDNPSPPPATIAAPETAPAGRACGLQNLYYTYDPAGNITHVHDDAQQTVYFRNKRVEPSSAYTYDALYRLVEAHGREHLGQAGGAPVPHSSDDAGRVGLLHAGDGNVMGTYLERYVYDAVGNLLQLQHRGSDPVHAGWTRAYTYAENSLTEPARHSNRLSRSTLNRAGANPQPEPYAHDPHGNMLRMPHLGGGGTEPNLHWDYRDQLRQVDKGGGGTAYYVYDASGQRVRKVWEKAPGRTEERIYLGGFELFRTYAGPVAANASTLERETVHVMDDRRPVALVETRTLGTEPDVPQRMIRLQFGNHLGSSTLELDERAQVLSYEEYAPYGSSTYQAARSQVETAKRYRYTGKERDEESGLYYHGARYYAAWLGRWVACDPLGPVDGGTDLYVYADCRPTVRIDPTGLAGVDPQDPNKHQLWQEGKPPQSAAAPPSPAKPLVEPDILMEVPITGPPIDASPKNRGYDKKMGDTAVRNHARMVGKDPKQYHVGHKGKAHSILMPGERTRGVPERKVTPDKKGNLNKSGAERVEAERRRVAAEEQGKKAWESENPEEFARPGEAEHHRIRAAKRAAESQKPNASAAKASAPKASAPKPAAPKAAAAEPVAPKPVAPEPAGPAAPTPPAPRSAKPGGPKRGGGGTGTVGGLLSLVPGIALGIAQDSAQARMDEAARQRDAYRGIPTPEQIELQDSCGYHFAGQLDSEGRPIWQYKPSGWQNFRWNFMELMDPFGGPQPGGSQNNRWST